MKRKWYICRHWGGDYNYIVVYKDFNPPTRNERIGGWDCMGQMVMTLDPHFVKKCMKNFPEIKSGEMLELDSVPRSMFKITEAEIGLKEFESE